MHKGRQGNLTILVPSNHSWLRASPWKSDRCQVVKVTSIRNRNWAQSAEPRTRLPPDNMIYPRTLHIMISLMLSHQPNLGDSWDVRRRQILVCTIKQFHPKSSDWLAVKIDSSIFVRIRLVSVHGCVRISTWHGYVKRQEEWFILWVFRTITRIKDKDLLYLLFFRAGSRVEPSSSLDVVQISRMKLLLRILVTCGADWPSSNAG